MLDLSLEMLRQFGEWGWLSVATVLIPNALASLGLLLIFRSSIHSRPLAITIVTYAILYVTSALLLTISLASVAHFAFYISSGLLFLGIGFFLHMVVVYVRHKMSR